MDQIVILRRCTLIMLLWGLSVHLAAEITESEKNTILVSPHTAYWAYFLDPSEAYWYIASTSRGEIYFLNEVKNTAAGWGTLAEGNSVASLNLNNHQITIADDIAERTPADKYEDIGWEETLIGSKAHDRAQLISGAELELMWYFFQVNETGLWYIVTAPQYELQVWKFALNPAGDDYAWEYVNTTHWNREFFQDPVVLPGDTKHLKVRFNNIQLPCEIQSNLESNVIGLLGGGYDSDRDRFKPASCLNGSETTIGAGSSRLDGSLTLGYEQLKEDFELDVNGEVHLGLFNVDAKTEFALNTLETSLSRSFVIKFVVNLPNGKFVLNQNTPLNALGQSIVATNDLCQFRTVCGDQFIDQTKRGASLYVALTFDFDTQERKQQFDLEFGAGVSGIGNIRAQAKNLSTELKKYGRMTIKAFQVGGRISRLADIFGTSSNGISPAVTCSLEDLSSCDTLINAILAYAVVFGQDAESNPETLGYKYATYNEINISAPSSELTSEIVLARNQLANAYEKQFKDKQLASTKLREFGAKLSVADKDQLTQIEQSLNTNIATLRNAAKVCFNNLGNCASKSEESFKSLITYDENWLKIIQPKYEQREYSDNIDYFKVSDQFIKADCAKKTSKNACLPVECELDVNRTYSPSGKNLSNNVGGPGYGVFVNSLNLTLGSGTHNIVTSGDRLCLESTIEICAEHKAFASGAGNWYSGYNVIYGKCLVK
jgi:hypothetical protein